VVIDGEAVVINAEAVLTTTSSVVINVEAVVTTTSSVVVNT